jgi:hypothetical protein
MAPHEVQPKAEETKRRLEEFQIVPPEGQNRRRDTAGWKQTDEESQDRVRASRRETQTGGGSNPPVDNTEADKKNA